MKPIASPYEVLISAFKAHSPIAAYALFSGGKDSVCSTDFAMENGATAVVHINTGIGIKETREFVYDTCQARNWPLKELHPPDKTYRDYVLKYGFPGPGAHIYSYVWLKERALNRLIRETKKDRRDRVALITGVRSFESARRMGFVEPVVRKGAKVWIAPLYAFSDIDLASYRNRRGLPTNEVSRKFGMSGECLCGAFAAPGEMSRLEKLYPIAAAQIHALEQEARVAGVHSEWGVRPRSRAKDGQMWMPMCVGCNVKASMYIREAQ